MSGEGGPLAVAEPNGAAEPHKTPYPRDFVVTSGAVRSADEEQADLIAYLRRRLANAATMAKRTPESDPDFTIYRDRQRQLQVMADEVSHGLHVGEVAVAARLALGEVTDGQARD